MAKPLAQGGNVEVPAAYPSTPTARAIWRRIAVSWSGVTCDGVARRRALEVVATRCDTAQQGLLQPFSAVGAIATDRLRWTPSVGQESG
jgi:hypothetical protein